MGVRGGIVDFKNWPYDQFPHLPTGHAAFSTWVSILFSRHLLCLPQQLPPPHKSRTAMKTVMAEPCSEKQLASNVKGVKFIKDKITKELSQAREDQREMEKKKCNMLWPREI